jgi:hypothetical protein
MWDTPEFANYGRLTLASGCPVLMNNTVYSSSMVYFTPYLGNKITLYNGSQWYTKSFAETSLNISAYTGSKVYDIFAADTGSAIFLTSASWTSGSVRNIDITFQDGIYVMSGCPVKKYLGTIYTTDVGKCSMYGNKFHLMNYYNGVQAALSIGNYSASHGYTTGAWRPWNNDATYSGSNLISIVTGVPVVCNITGNTDTSGSAVNQMSLTAISLNGTQIHATTIGTTESAAYYRETHSFGRSVATSTGLNSISLYEYGNSLTMKYSSFELYADFKG